MNLTSAKQHAVSGKDYTDTADVILNLHDNKTEDLAEYELFEVIADDAWKVMNAEDYQENHEETRARLDRIWNFATQGLRMKQQGESIESN
jgi:hypothetical protein